MLSIQAGGSSGGERTLINTSHSNIHRPGLTVAPSSGNGFFDVYTEFSAGGSSGGTRGTEPWCLNHPLECGLWGTASANGSSGSGYAIKEPGIK